VELKLQRKGVTKYRRIKMRSYHYAWVGKLM